MEAREGGNQGELGGGVVEAEFLNKLKRPFYEILGDLLYGRNFKIYSEEGGGLALAEFFVYKILLFTLEFSVSRSWKERPGAA